MKEIIKDLAKEAHNVFSVWIIGMFSWASYYLFQVSKWEQFKKYKFFISLFLAFFVAWLVWKFIPTELAYRDWIIWVCSFSAPSILEILQNKWAKIFFKNIK